VILDLTGYLTYVYYTYVILYLTSKYLEYDIFARTIWFKKIFIYKILNKKLTHHLYWCILLLATWCLIQLIKFWSIFIKKKKRWWSFNHITLTTDDQLETFSIGVIFTDKSPLNYICKHKHKAHILRVINAWPRRQWDFWKWIHHKAKLFHFCYQIHIPLQIYLAIAGRQDSSSKMWERRTFSFHCPHRPQSALSELFLLLLRSPLSLASEDRSNLKETVMLYRR